MTEITKVVEFRKRARSLLAKGLNAGAEGFPNFRKEWARAPLTVPSIVPGFAVPPLAGK